MSPLCINILLHYYARTNDYQQAHEQCHARSPAVKDSLRWFVGEGLLISRFGDLNWACESGGPSEFREDGLPVFGITEKGKAMVEHLIAVQVPVCVWVQPAGVVGGSND